VRTALAKRRVRFLAEEGDQLVVRAGSRAIAATVQPWRSNAAAVSPPMPPVAPRTNAALVSLMAP
jgi:hypothetical protein